MYVLAMFTITFNYSPTKLQQQRDRFVQQNRKNKIIIMRVMYKMLMMFKEIH